MLVDKRARKELAKFPRVIQLKFQALLETLQEQGKLAEPYAKKLANTSGLFEIRVKSNGQWRALYAYYGKGIIIILSAFAKKTQKTPAFELQKATSRLQDYE